MIRAIQTHNFRMLAANYVPLSRFQVLVGKNATGKSTLFSVLQLVSAILRDGVQQALRRYVGDFFDLCFDRERPIVLAAEIGTERGDEEVVLRYELELGIGTTRRLGAQILREQLWRLPSRPGGGPVADRPAAFHDSPPREWQWLVRKSADGEDYFRDESSDLVTPFRLGPDRPALGSVIEDPERFPLALAVRAMLREGVQTVALDLDALRRPSPPGLDPRLAADGANLAHVVRGLAERDPGLVDDWQRHVATAVAGLEAITVHERPEDRHLVLGARFAGNHREAVPSWLLSDGTLRLMALTLIGFAALPDGQAVYLIEEPENGLHPLAIQTVHEALSGPGDGVQVLCATHSPIFISNVTLDEILVFRRGEDGSALVRPGGEVAALRQWLAQSSLGDLFMTGVLA